MRRFSIILKRTFYKKQIDIKLEVVFVLAADRKKLFISGPNAFLSEDELSSSTEK